jgi:hypothetical protein
MKNRLTQIARLSNLKRPLPMVGDPPLAFRKFSTKDAAVYDATIAEKRAKDQFAMDFGKDDE